MLLRFVVNLVLFGPTFETPINTEKAPAQGIIFHKEGKIIITEKFINVQSLVPTNLYSTSTSRDSTSPTLNKMGYKISVL